MNSKVKKYLIVGLGPEFVCTIVGFIIGFVTYRDEIAANRTLVSNLLEWIININAGAVAHQIPWFIMTRLYSRSSGPHTLKTIWKPTAIGVVLTFVFVFLLNKGWLMPSREVLMTAIQVVSICVIVHIFLFQFGFYTSRIAFPPTESEDENENDDEEIDETRYIPLNVNERIEKVDIDQVSHIKVEDHYCTIVYLKENQWQNWTLYGKLKSFEEQYSPRLVRINRSVLANPNMVQSVKKSSGKHLVTLKGEPDATFSLSATQKHVLERLIPIVQ